MTVRSSRSRERAARLRREADNLVSAAATGSNPAQAAAFIDEAVRLARRSRELAAPADDAASDTTPA